jgi:hypothetical protein
MHAPEKHPARRAPRWLIAGALLAVVPKCALCLLAYAGLGAAAGLGRPEMCGADLDTNGHALLGLAALAATLALAGWVARHRRRTG